MNDKSQRLRQLREDVLGLSQDEFSLKINTDQSNLSKLESGKRNVGPRLSDAIVSAFGLSKLWWETGEGEIFNRNITISQKGTGNAIGSKNTTTNYGSADIEIIRLQTKVEMLEKENEHLRELLKNK